MAGELIPSDLSATQQAICQALRDGNTRTNAAKLCGINRSTLWRWIEADATFCNAVERAEADAEALHVASIRAAAAGGEVRKRKLTRKPDGTVVVEEEFTGRDWRAAAWWLERRKRQWRENNQPDLSQMTDEQILRLFELVAQETHDGGDEAETAAEAPLEAEGQ